MPHTKPLTQRDRDSQTSVLITACFCCAINIRKDKEGLSLKKQVMLRFYWYKDTVEPQLSEHHGRHTIRSDNRGVRIDEGNRNLLSVGYRVGDN